MSDVDDEIAAPSWAKRRPLIYLALLFCGGEIVYLTAFAVDNEINQTLALVIPTAGFGVLGSYVFGAVWDSSNYLSALTSRGGGGRPRNRPGQAMATDPTPPEGYAP